MQKSSVNNLIFSSSAVVYGESKHLPINEKHSTSPLSPYGLTKLFGEKFLDYVSAGNNKLKIISLRYFNPVGSHNSGEIGDNPNKPNNIMPLINDAAIGKRNYFKYMALITPQKMEHL
jgi:UDP-glucose 4-epimerase